MDPNEQLLQLVKARGAKREPFGRGISTADRYVKTLQECLGEGRCFKMLADAKKNQTFGDVMLKAAQTLVYANDDMVATDKQTDSFELPDGVELPKNTLMVFKNVLTTPRKDRDDDILRTDGAEVDPRMLLLWQHVHTLPIGKMLAVHEHDAQKLVLISSIVDMNELSHDAAVMIDNGMGRFSHGFRALEFDKLKEEEGSTTGPGGFDVKRFEIMEESLVSVPSNVDAEVEDVMLSLIDGGKLTSPIIKDFGAGIREMRPKSVPVNLDLKVTVNGKEVTDGQQATVDEPAGKSCGCGGAPKEAGTEAQDKSAGSTGTSDAEVDDTKRHSLEGSWEWIERKLRSQAERYLGMSGAVNSRNRFTWVAGTFADHAIVCSEHHESGVDNEFLYFKVAWSMEEGEPRFTGEPQAVEIVTTVEIRERSPLFESKGGAEESADGTKAGRALSRRNLQALNDVKSDLEELQEKEDLSRGGNAICERCVSKLGSIIDAATPNESEEEERQPAEVNVKEAMAVIFASGNREDRKQLLRVLSAMDQIDNAKAVRKQLLSWLDRDTTLAATDAAAQN